MKDNGGRRQLADRRSHPQPDFFPERRAIRRRNGCLDCLDRRSGRRMLRPAYLERRQNPFHIFNRTEEVI